MQTSKTRTSFYRRLYVAYLICSGRACSVPALMEATGMPRRTAQDTIAALAELDIECEFEQAGGSRNHIGRYRIKDWGAIDPRWVERNLANICQVLDYPMSQVEK
ncbi:winged helix-turn-helix domain-containing protein [Pseudomonas typographi]|uniref:Helix-turn-helix domain-containing protein n=1 Tax=Pseudomonas typographi TaxID=2715964 RepID=A0ABR7YVW2_9PSED|nr:winged helix-turn-helix domain-containing protein [Pseudomonas typographi]MBD1549892.1 helix-turn-helix domain-containing protein [Pseudomonas typographi]MBD1585273.1 helix-turn-helix domain-containing protein [Pseudomonas typographi]MBD1597320.1 helix-turn-helix domain-containing protein [Pseudomonas typographi]